MPHLHTTTRTTTTRRHHGLFGRSQPVHHRQVHHQHQHHNHHSHHHHHQKRHVTLGDKVSGALLKLKGTITHRPGQKAAGTRRMHGTDGRGSRRSRFSSHRKYRY
ncbi:hypothetical protein F5Y12DRAFT_356575 [Xylaria sp. FL1777]|nr:hypothetical protein F5Y12DRAFT_356575 [Xylaria sp. FL1777]